jgi:hypothetical protein
MTITTRNYNLRNDSRYARHRSTWKGQTNVLDSVVTDLKAAPGVRYKRYHGTPVEVRHMWSADFGKALPVYMAHNFTGTSGVDTWLGARSPFTDDVKVIWADFVLVFTKRSSDGTRLGTPAGTVRELLFMSHTQQHFDLIYSKWGLARGKHWFFHWTSDVAPKPVHRATIDVASDDEDDESTECD